MPKTQYSRTDYIAFFPQSIQDEIRKTLKVRLSGQYVEYPIMSNRIVKFDKLSAKGKNDVIRDIMSGRIDILPDWSYWVGKANYLKR